MKSNKNNHYLKLPFIILLIFVFINFNGNAQEQEQAFKPSGKIWGLMFGDVFYKAAGDTLAFGRSEYAKEPTESLGAKLRRVYFGYDFNISPRWSTRFLLEGTS
ncbi:MAG: hypothetical protein U5K51_12925 [Flavobacteriaceae bacterium]|nr:hypothetical protein [Flavobacteriaceae bacterium]